MEIFFLVLWIVLIAGGLLATRACRRSYVAKHDLDRSLATISQFSDLSLHLMHLTQEVLQARHVSQVFIVPKRQTALLFSSKTETICQDVSLLQKVIPPLLSKQQCCLGPDDFHSAEWSRLKEWSGMDQLSYVIAMSSKQILYGAIFIETKSAKPMSSRHTWTLFSDYLDSYLLAYHRIVTLHLGQMKQLPVQQPASDKAEKQNALEHMRRQKREAIDRVQSLSHQASLASMIRSLAFDMQRPLRRLFKHLEQSDGLLASDSQFLDPLKQKIIATEYGASVWKELLAKRYIDTTGQVLCSLVPAMRPEFLLETCSVTKTDQLFTELMTRQSRALLSKSLGSIRGEAERVDRILAAMIRQGDLDSSYLSFDMNAKQDAAPLDLKPVIEQVLLLFEGHFKRHGIDCSFDYSTTQAALVAEDDFRGILMNLISNAIQAMEDAEPDNPKLSIRVHDSIQDNDADADSSSHSRYLYVDVTDNGCGIDLEKLAHVTQPSFSTRLNQDGSNSGLGLAYVQRLINQYGGSLAIESEPLLSTCFSMKLPGAPF